VQLQGEPRDAAVNFDTYRILQLHRTCCFLATAWLSCWTGMFNADNVRQVHHVITPFTIPSSLFTPT